MFNTKQPTEKLVLVLFCLFLVWTKSDAEIIQLSKFGILPGIGRNNTDGFLKLSTYLKGKNNIQINFKKGVYIVGSQKKSGNHFVTNISNIFSIVDCKNITINGNGSILKYSNNLMYGSFDSVTLNPLNNPNNFSNPLNAAYPGNCIAITNSSEVKILNLQLDGNLPNTKIGGRYGDVGIQLWYRGFYIVNSTNVSLRNLMIHHFGLDGIEVSNKPNLTSSSKYQIELSKVKCYYNGRQGLSWTGGNGFIAEDCEFSRTGKSKVASSPGAGIDIEPEVGICENGLFRRCKFEDNTGYAFGSDYFGLPIKNIVFEKCVFGGSTGGALFVSNGGVTIDHSTIYGQIVRPSGISINERVIIKNSDLYDYNPYNNSFPIYASNHLIDAGGQRSYFDFINCKIYLRKVKLCYIESGISVESNMPTFTNNTVNFIGSSYPPNDFLALFRGCVLADNEFNFVTSSLDKNGNFLFYQGVILKGINRITGNSKNIGWNSSNGPKDAK